METRQYVTGNVITMRLMRREKGSLVALPSCQWVKVEEPIHFGGETFCWLRDTFVVFTWVCLIWHFPLFVADVHLRAYSKLLLASQEQVLGLLAEERVALQTQLSQEKDDPQACFIQSALLQLQVHMLSCSGIWMLGWTSCLDSFPSYKPLKPETSQTSHATVLKKWFV